MPIAITVSKSRTLVLLFMGCVVIAVSLAYVYLPTATITISPLTSQKNVDQTIVLSTAATSPDFIKYILPAKLVEKEITESKEVKRPGQVTDDFARGTLALINNSPEEQRLLPKSHLRHEATGVMFLTDSPAVIPPQGQITMNVTAKEKGASGNVTPGKFIFDKLPASAQTVVFAQSEVPMSGGLSVETALTDEEITAAKQAVLDTAKTRALGELTAQAGGASIRSELLTVSPTAEHVSATSGSKVSSFTVTSTITARGFITDNNDLLSLTLLALRQASDQDQDFVSFDPQSFKVAVTRADFARQQAEVVGSLTGTFAHKISPNILNTQNLAGLSAAEAADHFKQLQGVGDVQVAFSPFWVKTIPSRAGAIKVEIKN